MTYGSGKVKTKTLRDIHEMVQEDIPVYIETFQTINGKTQYRWVRVRESKENGATIHLTLQEDSVFVQDKAEVLRRYVNSPPQR